MTHAKDLSEVRGQERARRVIEIAAAGRHHLLMIGAPGASKSMLATRLPGILPPLTPAEALETSVIQSVAGMLAGRHFGAARPLPAASYRLDGGDGRRRAQCAPRSGEPAHNGVLFLDELLEFERRVIDELREPIETGEIHVSRANAHIRYPARFLLVAAANPCRCGEAADAGQPCPRAALPVGLSGANLGADDGPFRPAHRHATGQLRRTWPAALRAKARPPWPNGWRPRAPQAQNASPATRRRGSTPMPPGGCLKRSRRSTAIAGHCWRWRRKAGLTPRGYHRILRAARTIADLDASENIRQPHLARRCPIELPLAGPIDRTS